MKIKPQSYMMVSTTEMVPLDSSNVDNITDPISHPMVGTNKIIIM